MQLKLINLKKLTSLSIIFIVSCTYKNENHDKFSSNVIKRKIEIYNHLHNPVKKKLIYLAEDCCHPSWYDLNAYLKVGKSYCFNEEKFNYYIEPTRSDSNIDNYNRINLYDVIEFYCQEDSVFRLPQNTELINSNPPIGRVIMYSNYKKVGKLVDGKYIEN